MNQPSVELGDSGRVAAKELLAGSLSPASRAFIQHRVKAFARVVTILYGVFLAATLLGPFVLDLPHELPRQVWLLRAVGVAGPAAVWAFCASGERSTAAIFIAEGLGLLSAVFSWTSFGVVMARNIAPNAPALASAVQPDYIDALQLFLIARWSPILLAVIMLNYVFVLRAAYVPSSARMTFVLSAVPAVPTAIAGYLANADTADVAMLWLKPWFGALAVGLQCVALAAVCTAISRVIYGLRAEVREAQRLGQYTLTELIGEGGMGRVYRASHAMLRRPTAVKLLTPHKAGREAIERFEREVQLTAELTHPNTVTVFDYGRTADGILYYAMELLEGASLEEVVAVDGPQPAGRVKAILHQVAGALGEAHAIGLIHRDVKPGNIILCAQGGEYDVPKVVDFGLVKDFKNGAANGVSRAGTIAGTPLYMAPETLVDDVLPDPRSDLYAPGAVGYFLLTGEHVFNGRSVVEVLSHHLQTAPVPPSERRGDHAIPASLEGVVMDLLRKAPDERPRDAAAVRARLAACSDVEAWTQRSAKRWWETFHPLLVRRRREKNGHPRTIAVDVHARTRRVAAEHTA